MVTLIMSTFCEYLLIFFPKYGLTSATGNNTFKQYVDNLLLTVVSQILTQNAAESNGTCIPRGECT